mmetsp:Transcript_117545/g.333109  ORF Transcript_117545/g.333109 Transcript_117545/m.333109 type:complete len:569 (-) Transcript_117545:138-1844(-)
MGNKNSTTAKGELKQVRKRLASDLGYVGLSGRYHTLPHRISADYELSSVELGQGYNGSVVLAKAKGTGDTVAVKPFKLYGIAKHQKRELRNEVEIFLQMDHPHIGRLHDVYESETLCHMVMEHLEGGELFDRISKHRKFAEKDAANAAYQMLLALNYLHGKKIVHRDIKCENFLYAKKNDDSLKLIDFGFSRIHSGENKNMQLNCGTLHYTAPEVLKGSYTNACDLWSFGCVAFILVMGYMPFSGTNKEVQKQISEGTYLRVETYWERLSKPLQDFLERLLVVNSEQRLSAQAALEHPWIADRASLSSDSSQLDMKVVESIIQFSKASKFRRICMSMMAWSLTSDQRQLVNAEFLKIDKDKQGTISMYELKQVLQETVRIDNEEVQRIFSALDYNHNEQIDYSDFLAAMMSSRIVMHEGLLEQAFKRFDVDMSGEISVVELKRVLGGCCGEAEIQQIMRDADVSGDGKITIDEFMEYIKGEAAESHVEAAQRIIDKELGSQAPGGEESSHANAAPEEMPAASIEAPAVEATSETAAPCAERETSALTQPVSPDPTSKDSAKSRSCQIL